MKILKGSLAEDLYDWPNSEAITAPHDTTLKPTMTLRKTTVLSENDVAYMSDKVCPSKPMLLTPQGPREVVSAPNPEPRTPTPPTHARHICFSLKTRGAGADQRQKYHGRSAFIAYRTRTRIRWQYRCICIRRLTQRNVSFPYQWGSGRLRALLIDDEVLGL